MTARVLSRRPRHVVEMLRAAPARVWSAPRVRALRLMWRAAPGLSLLAVAFVLAEGTLPVLVLIAMGRVTGAIPGAVVFGLGSKAGLTLVGDLALAGGVYALSLMRGPFEDGLSAAVNARVEALMQAMLTDAACAPVGIEPLEDQDVLERLASAQGQLLNARPAQAPMQVVSLTGDRLTGILACVVLAAWRWWVGLGLLVLWLLVRRPLAKLIRAHDACAKRRSAAAPQLAAMLGIAADHRSIGLRELATLLPMLPASLSAGSVSFADIQLEVSNRRRDLG